MTTVRYERIAETRISRVLFFWSERAFNDARLERCAGFCVYRRTSYDGAGIRANLSRAGVRRHGRKRPGTGSARKRFERCERNDRRAGSSQ